MTPLAEYAVVITDNPQQAAAARTRFPRAMVFVRSGDCTADLRLVEMLVRLHAGVTPACPQLDELVEQAAAQYWARVLLADIEARALRDRTDSSPRSPAVPLGLALAAVLLARRRHGTATSPV